MPHSCWLTCLPLICWPRKIFASVSDTHKLYFPMTHVFHDPRWEALSTRPRSKSGIYALEDYIKAAWTSRLIPDAGRWTDLPKIQLTFHTTQALTSHGCFQYYLHHMNKAASPILFELPQHLGHCWTHFVPILEVGRNESWCTRAFWAFFDRRGYTRFTLWTCVFGTSHGHAWEGYDSPESEESYSLP